MATRDNLKKFSDFDGYSGSLTKKDMDDNLVMLADAVDDAGYFSNNSEDVIVPKEDGKSFSTRTGGLVTGIGMYFDVSKKAFRAGDISENEANLGSYSIAMGYHNTASGYCNIAMGYQNTVSGSYSVAMGGHNTVSGEYSIAMGYHNTPSGYCSVAMGYHNTASGYYSIAMGYESNNSADNSFLIGYEAFNKTGSAIVTGCKDDYYSNTVALNLMGVQSIATGDDTATDCYPLQNVYPSSVEYVKVKGVIFSEDQSEKWIFERSFIVTTDSSGNITISNDVNNDIAKDVSAWNVSIATYDGSDPFFTFNVTGETDKNIKWGFSINRNITVYVI